MTNIFLRDHLKIASIFKSFSLYLILALGASSPTYADDGVGVPIRAEIGKAIQLDPSHGLAVATTTLLTPVWSWVSRPAISVAEFSDAGLIRPFVTPDVAGVYVARLDLFAPAATDPANSVLVTFGTENLPPVAEIAGRSLPENQSALFLDGTASYDVDGDALTYDWTVVSAPADGTARFSGPTAPITEVILSGAGDFVLGLSVQDYAGNTSEQQTFDVSFTGMQLGRTCTAETATLLLNDGSQNVTFDIGDVTNGLPENYVINVFDTDRGGEISEVPLDL